MVVDRFSPIAPARVRALALPMGKIKRTRFADFVNRLTENCVVRLGDVTPDGRSDRPMFSPLAFPSGRLIFEFSTSAPESSQLALAPFEQFREPFVIIGVADSKEYPFLSAADDGGSSPDSKLGSQSSQFEGFTNELRERFPRALVHSVFFFDCIRPIPDSGLVDGCVLIPPPEHYKATTMKTIMCDVTSLLLAEMSTLAKSLQALPSIASPATNKAPASNGIIVVGDQWTPDPKPGITRSNSQLGANSQAMSPIGSAATANHRMSMPANLPSSSTGTHSPGSRPTSPNERAGTPPAKTFEEIAGLGPSSKSLTRETSRDRVSVHGFGSGTIDERNRKKGKGRVGIVIGGLYMQAGRWQDALRELVENTTNSRDVGDHMWHAKGLEGILICLLLLSWIGAEFQIPQICIPYTEKPTGVRSASNPSINTPDSPQSITPQPSRPRASNQALAATIPDLVNMILSIYTRSNNYAKDSVPQFVFSETTIRLSKLMATMNLSGGGLDDDCFKHFVGGSSFTTKPVYGVPRQTVTPNKTEIATLLLRAMTWSSENSNLSLTDTVSILAGVAAVFSLLDMRRKKAMVIRELLTILVPSLYQARKVAAAEQGIHPLASMSAVAIANGINDRPLTQLSTKTEQGLLTLLSTIGSAYGLPNMNPSFPSAKSVTNGDSQYNTREENTAGHISSSGTLMDTYQLNQCGSLETKLEFLELCIELSESLMETAASLAFTAALLRTAAISTYGEATWEEMRVDLGKEHQARLITHFINTTQSASRLHLQECEPEYWDPFLVCGIELAESSSLKTLASHRKSAIRGIKDVPSSGPFIHNSFLKSFGGSTAHNLMVAGEEQIFYITLQNRYDFDVELQSLSLVTEGASLESHVNNLTLGGSRTQQLFITATPLAPGPLKIVGCRVKVFGCKEQVFPVFSDSWRPQIESKISAIGLAAFQPQSPNSSAPELASTRLMPVLPKSAIVSLDFTVVAPQPLLELSQTSLSESSIMVLEGQSASFSVTVRNISKIPVNFARVSFDDSATAALQSIITNKDTSPVDLYELESQLKTSPVLRLNGSFPDRIEPGQDTQFSVTVLGKPGLSDALIQVDYANLKAIDEDPNDDFYMRKIIIPFTVTVNASIQLQRIDLIPFPNDFAWAKQQMAHSNAGRSDAELPGALMLSESNNRLSSMLDNIGRGTLDTEYCLLVLDFRNAWPTPLSVLLQVGEKGTKTSDGDEETSAYSVSEMIQPGHVARVVLLLRRIHLHDPYARIPSVDPAKERQFVVSATRFSPEAERNAREAFWYRKEVLRSIIGSWRDEDGQRNGELDLRGIHFTPRMIEILRTEELGVDMSVISTEHNGVRQTGRTRFALKVEELVVLRTKLHNQSRQPIHAILRLQPSLAHQPYDVTLDLEKRLAWSGLLQRTLPIINPGESFEIDLGVCALSSGEYEFGAMVEEIQAAEQEGIKSGLRSRARTGSLLDALPPLTKKRIWFAEEACVLVARKR